MKFRVRQQGTFTTNIVKAAPVKWDHNVVYNSKAAQAVVINAGIANACTGEEGMGYCKQTAEKVEKVLGIASRRGVSCIYRSYWHAAPNRPYL